MRADAGDFNNRELRGKSCPACGVIERTGNRSRRNFSDRSARFANQERDDRCIVVIMRAGKKSIAAFDAVDETVFHQKIECAIYGNRRRARHILRKLFDNLIGAQRAMGYEQRAQDLPANRRELLAPLRAYLLRMRKRVLGAAAVVVIWGRKSGLRLGHMQVV